MRLDFAGERVLAVVAHPDDAELLCAGTLARAKDDGAAVGICVLCRGDKGQPATPIPQLAAVRKREAQASAKVLGGRLLWCGFADGELADGPSERRKLLRAYRAFRPTLVLAHAPEDYHADHRAVSALAEAVTWFAASRGQTTRQPVLERQPQLWWMDTLEMHGFEPGFYLDISRWLDVKTRMLRCHRSQLQRAGDEDFAPLEQMMQRQSSMRGSQAGVVAAEAFRIQRSFKRVRAW